MTAALLLALSYLAGSIPFAWLVVRRVKGVDLRKVGSGNVGATNAARVLGRRWFPLLFALDAAKGALPVLLLAPLAGWDGPEGLRMSMACGLAAILGHVFPAFLGFRGGKGVATGAGVLGALVPLATACAFGVFLACLAAFGFVSLASVVATVALPFFAWLLHAPGEGEAVVLCAVVAVLVAVLHRKNYARIAAGTEPRVLRKREQAGA